MKKNSYLRWYVVNVEKIQYNTSDKFLKGNLMPELTYETRYIDVEVGGVL